MGAFGHRSGCSCGHVAKTVEVVVERPGMPDPHNFCVEATEQIGRFLIARIRYPDATNFEGRKILVFQNIVATDLLDATTLDPHFCDGDHLAPIARFIPTAQGFKMAKVFCRAYR
jgi:hypothetical protein